MTDFCLIESNSPLDTCDVSTHIETARGLARRGHNVTLFLVQNGVLPARRGSRADDLTASLEAGVKVLADSFSLRERGIGADELLPGVAPSPLESVVDSLAAGARTLWH